MSKRALILGVGGQDGSYLAELLLEKGYEVHGLYRRSSVDNLGRLIGCRDRLVLCSGDVLDAGCLYGLIEEIGPSEIYNMADQDHVPSSTRIPAYQMDITAKGVVVLLEAVRRVDCNIRVFQPCSATMFGASPIPQNESSPISPMSPYALAKAAAFLACRYYREHHSLFVSTAVFFNHDSPRRREDYFLHRVIRGVLNWENSIVSGELDVKVDIGYAPEYVKAAWTMLQLPKADDFCIGTGQAPSVEEWIGIVCEVAGVPFREPIAAPYLASPSLQADCTKARATFGWDPKVDAEGLVHILVDHYRSKG